MQNIKKLQALCEKAKDYSWTLDEEGAALIADWRDWLPALLDQIAADRVLREEAAETKLDPVWVKAEIIRDERPTEERIKYIQELALQCLLQEETRHLEEARLLDRLRSTSQTATSSPDTLRPGDSLDTH